MKCCMCKQKIMPEPLSGWDQGNNAEPVVKGGRCCNKCNETVVMVRIMKAMEEK
jgi:hypothetical protein